MPQARLASDVVRAVARAPGLSRPAVNSHEEGKWDPCAGQFAFLSVTCSTEGVRDSALAWPELRVPGHGEERHAGKEVPQQDPPHVPFVATVQEVGDGPGS